jgi:hypothetical protein
MSAVLAPSVPDTQESSTDGRKWVFTALVVVGLVAAVTGFAVLLGLLASDAEAPASEVWQRRLYLFGTIEALAFTGVGWLSGREVHRERSASAQREAGLAVQQAAAERSRADRESAAAADGRQLAGSVAASTR